MWPEILSSVEAVTGEREPDEVQREKLRRGDARLVARLLGDVRQPNRSHPPTAPRKPYNGRGRSPYCRSGRHAMEGDNVRWHLNSNGVMGRQCRACLNEGEQRRRDERKALTGYTDGKPRSTNCT
jgi:hypothetical protein